VAWQHASPSFLSRLDNDATLSLIYFPLRQIRIEPYVRPEIRYYPTDSPTQVNRRDFHLRTGAIVTWTPQKNISFAAEMLWNGNYSSMVQGDYQVLLPSIGFFGSIAF
jgi:hypothetical protein